MLTPPVRLPRAQGPPGDDRYASLRLLRRRPANGPGCAGAGHGAAAPAAAPTRLRRSGSTLSAGRWGQGAGPTAAGTLGR